MTGTERMWPAMPERNLVKAIWAAARKQGLDSEALYDLAERIGGVRSLRALTPAQTGRLLDQLNAGQRRHNPAPPKIWRLWNTLYCLGGIEHRDSAALRAFVRRQTGLDDPQWVDSAVAVSVIEALKSMIDRALPRGGGWSFGGPVALRLARDFFYLCEAAGLVNAPATDGDRFVAWACERFGWADPSLLGGAGRRWSYDEANAVFEALGPQWRRHRGLSTEGEQE